MNKFVFTADTCRKPVVNMTTGRVIANSFTPYFDKKTLSLSFITLEMTDGEKLNLPSSSLCFMNDLCTMVTVPDMPFIPDGNSVCALLGTPLSAKAGEITLFSFGSISGTDVDEDGSVTVLRMDDGNSFPVPRDGSVPAGDGASFASSFFRNAAAAEPAPAPTIKKMPEFPRPAEPEKTEPKPAFAAPKKEEEPKSEPLSVRSPILQKPVFKTTTEPENETEPAVLPPLNKYKAEDNILPGESVTIAEKEEEALLPDQTANEKPRKSWKDVVRNIVRRYLPPIAAMFIFMILYFFFFHRYIE